MPILTAEERVGTVLDGKYELMHIAARGGMGVLFEGRHCLTQRRVAVKLLRAEEDPAGTRAERFVTEARAAASLHHPNVVDILDMGEAAGAPYVVMEFLDGSSLEAILHEHERLSAQETLELLLPIIGALAKAHEAGIIHRDLKPANIFVSRDASGRRVPKLLDFGVAKVWRDVGLTDSGTIVGTPHYMSPEQASGGEIGPATDVWAAGVVLYRCLSGALPFPGTNAGSVLAAVHRGNARSLVELDPQLPPRFCAAIERAINKDPARRYADMRALAHALLVTATADSIVLPTAPDGAQWQEWIDAYARGAGKEAASALQALLETSGTTQSVEGAINSARAVQSPAAPSRAIRVAAIAALLAGVPAAALLAHRGAELGAAGNPTIATSNEATRTMPSAGERGSSGGDRTPVSAEPSGPAAPAPSPSQTTLVPVQAAEAARVHAVTASRPARSARHPAPAASERASPRTESGEPAQTGGDRRLPAIRTEW